MSPEAKTDSTFNLFGTFALELKSVLAAARMYEGEDYIVGGFDKERQSKGLCLLQFHSKGKATEAATTWEKHTRTRGHQ